MELHPRGAPRACSIHVYTLFVPLYFPNARRTVRLETRGASLSGVHSLRMERILKRLSVLFQVERISEVITVRLCEWNCHITSSVWAKRAFNWIQLKYSVIISELSEGKLAHIVYTVYSVKLATAWWIGWGGG